MDRRQVLKYIATLTGTALCAPLTAATLPGDSSQATPTSTRFDPAFFSRDDFQLLTHIMDLILPRTDSPSASDVGVDKTMDHMFAVVFEPDYQQKFTKLFTALRQHLAAVNFAELSSDKQTAVLRSLELNDKQSEAYWAFIDIKQQTVAYYLVSEAIAEHFLNYLPIPGEYKPCVPLAELDGKAWAI